MADREVLATHPDLSPELGDELRLLGMLERARGTRPADPPTNIPGYSLIRELHRGGQGVVYEAVHTATGARSAIKVLRDGLLVGHHDTARFDREIRILGELDDPGIVRVLGSGRHEGTFYYVMELVDGVPLDTYAEGRPPRDRAGLMARVCEAVNAAHLKGIIHRDLKPANIIVDGEGRARVLDFGLARLSEDRPERTVATKTGQFVGSMPWASPEQASGDPARVDVRTDVYALGVMLYQVLTGRFPYAVDGGLRDVLDNILRAEPARPRSLDRSIPTDLEAIAMKALAKERERRYQSAGAMAEDLRRFLDGWPITARPPSAIYQLSRLARRHRGVVVAGAAVLAALAAGAAGTGLALVRALDAEQESKQKQLAAEREAEAAQAANAYLEDLFQMVAPSIALGRDTAVMRQMLDEARVEIGKRYATRPDLQARLRAGVAHAYFAIGALDEAEQESREAVRLAGAADDRSDDLAQAQQVLGMTLLERTESVEAEPVLRSCLEIRLARSVPEPERIVTARLNHSIALSDLKRWDEAEHQARVAVDLARTVEPDPERLVSSALSTLGAILYDRGRCAEALGPVDEAIAIRERLSATNHPSLVSLYSNRSHILGCLNRDAEGEAAAVRALDLSRRLLPPTHPQLLDAIMRLATCMQDRGAFAESEPLAREAAEKSEAKYGSRHRSLGESLYLLGRARRLQGDVQQGEALYRRALGTYDAADPACPNSITDPMRGLAESLMARKEFDEAEALFRDSLERRLRQYGEHDIRSAVALEDVSLVLTKAGRLADAEPWARRALTAKTTIFPPDHPRLADSQRSFARILLALGKAEDAAPLMELVIAADIREHGSPSWPVASAMIAHASCLIKLDRLAEAERELAAAAAMFPSISDLPEDAPRFLAGRMAALHDKRGEPEKAEAFRRQAGSHAPK